MTKVLLSAPEGPTIPIHLVSPETIGDVLGSRDTLRIFAAACDFSGKEGQILLVPATDGGLELVLFGGRPDPMSLRALPGKLPAGDYRLEGASAEISATEAALAFLLGSYRFDRYKPAKGGPRRLVAPSGVDVAEVEAIAAACALARDMVNTPASDMGPADLQARVRAIAQTHGATVTVSTGEALLADNYPAVHAVGRAAAPDRSPRMIELTWGVEGAPALVLVGKGVTFDTGGLDLKPSAGMRWMKKDMGGAAHALALADLVMRAALPVRLTLLIPAVENAVSGDAMRPGDVLSSRKGLTIEVGNTDAEGRLILADALTRAGELSPDLTIDLATLTGAARVALGPQVIPFFTADDGLAAAIGKASVAVDDPLWRLPLWAGYEDSLSSDIADLKNDPDGWAQAGCVTAALFLQRFAPQAGAWVHLDIFAWNTRGRPGWPSGAEAQGIRALYAMLKDRYR